MNRKIRFCMFFAFCSIFLLSCASTKFEGKAALVGRVSDENGKAVEKYHLFLENGREAVSDSAGMFVFRDVASASYQIDGGGWGWCTVKKSIDFNDRKSIVCIQVKSLEGMFEDIDSFLNAEDLQSAKRILTENEAYNKTNPLFLCYQNLISYWESPSQSQRDAFFQSLKNYK